MLGPDRRSTVAVRLTLGGGTTWCAEAPSKPPPATNDTPAGSVGQKGTVPASGPPMP